MELVKYQISNIFNHFLGFGLPIAKNYSKYLGGSLNLLPLEGYGTDAYLYLNKLTDGEELN